jgi:hypothetical protein
LTRARVARVLLRGDVHDNVLSADTRRTVGEAIDDRTIVSLEFLARADRFDDARECARRG